MAARTLITGPDDAHPAYRAAIARGDGTAANALVRGLLAGGVDPVVVLTDVIAAAQRDVGTRWQRGEWTIADEHAATALAVSATRVVTEQVRLIPATRGRVIVSCAEREWHALPAMIIEAALRSRGWDTTLLGASTSPFRLSQYLQDLGPDAVAVSCSVLGALPTSRKFIEASTSSGVPILVGGPAFGGDDVRARALGATAWAASAAHAIATLPELPTLVSPAPALPAAPAAEQTELELQHERFTNVLRRRWSVISERRRADAAEVAADAVDQVMHAVWAALLTGDHRPLPETAWWLADLLDGRGEDAGRVAELRDVLADELSDLPISRDLVGLHFTT